MILTKIRRFIVATCTDSLVAASWTLLLLAIGWRIGYLLRAQVPVPWQILGSFIGLILVAAWQLAASRVPASLADSSPKGN